MVLFMDKGLLEELSYYFNPHASMADFSWKQSIMAPFNKIWPGGGQPAGTWFNSWWDKAIGGQSAPAPMPMAA